MRYVVTCLVTRFTLLPLVVLIFLLVLLCSTRLPTRGTRLSICNTRLSSRSIRQSTRSTRLAIRLSTRSTGSTTCWSFYN